jgi:hypothetical protein
MITALIKRLFRPRPPRRRLVCAWCRGTLDDLGAVRRGDVPSHGICGRCAVGVATNGKADRRTPTALRRPPRPVATYWAVRTADGVRVHAGTELLPWRLDLGNHSPTGFEWGFLGSGPAQLALALLAHRLGDAVGLRYAHQLKAELVAGLAYGGWEMDALLLDDFAEHAALEAGGGRVDWDAWRGWARSAGRLREKGRGQAS